MARGKGRPAVIAPPPPRPPLVETLTGGYVGPILSVLPTHPLHRDTNMSECRAALLIPLLAIAMVGLPSSALAQDLSGPCSLLTLDQIAEVTGVRIAETFPAGNLSAGAQCTYGGGDRPPTLIVSMARGAPGARQAYETNLRFPGAAPVDSLGVQATWVPMPRKLAVLARDDLYVVITMSDAGAGGPTATRARAIALARLVLKSLGA